MLHRSGMRVKIRVGEVHNDNEKDDRAKWSEIWCVNGWCGMGGWLTGENGIRKSDRNRINGKKRGGVTESSE